jgi:hypothetical protein
LAPDHPWAGKNPADNAIVFSPPDKALENSLIMKNAIRCMAV